MASGLVGGWLGAEEQDAAVSWRIQPRIVP